MSLKKVIFFNVLFIASTALAQPSQPTSTSSINLLPNIQSLEDLPRSAYSPKTIEFKGSEIPEGEILGVLFSNTLIFKMVLFEEDYSNFVAHKKSLALGSSNVLANESNCLLAHSIDENNPSPYDADELADKLIELESKNSEKLIAVYADLLDSSSDFAFKVFENYKAYIRARSVTKKVDYEYEATNNTLSFIQNQKTLCSKK